MRVIHRLARVAREALDHPRARVGRGPGRVRVGFGGRGRDNGRGVVSTRPASGESRVRVPVWHSEDSKGWVSLGAEVARRVCNVV